MLNKVQQEMKKQQLDGLWITSSDRIESLVGICLNPMERFLGLYLSENQKPILLANILFVLPKSNHYDLVEYYDHDDLGQKIVDISCGQTIGVDKTMQYQYILPLLTNKKNVVIGSDCLDVIRAIKDQVAIQKMKRASEINDQAMLLIKNKLVVGVSEREIADEIRRIYQQLDAQGESFECIVAFGDHGADPHAVVSDRKLKAGESIIVDMGCVVDGYCSDMTRTYFLKENTASKAYQACLQANLAAIAAIKPGVRFCDLDKAARDVIEQAGYGPYFIHRLGHGIGQSVHEPYDVSASNQQFVLPGMCFSIEPGIYVENQFGIRIEDLVYVDEFGYGQLLNFVDKEHPVLK